MEHKYYVYAIFRPDGTPCYIGKGHGSRMFHHFRSGGRAKNPHLDSIIKKAADNRLELFKEKVLENLSNEEACRIEIELISFIGREPRGPLVNMTDGGEGFIGRIQTITEKRKRALSMKGRPVSKETRAKIAASQPMLGKKFSPEMCAKLGRKRGFRHTEEHRIKISRILSGRPRSAEARKSISRGKTGVKFGELHKAALSRAWVVRKSKFIGRHFNIPILEVRDAPLR